MRLLYIHLPRYLALRELHCPFRQTDLLPMRRGTLNFVVGLNGTGKSSLLRAIFQTFRQLHENPPQPPRFAITLAYTVQLPRDLAPSSQEGFVVVDRSRDRGRSASLYLYVLEPEAADRLGKLRTDEWQAGLAEIRAGRRPQWPLGPQLIGAAISDLQGNSLVQYALPQRVLAYTSGRLLPWRRLMEPEFDASEIEDVEAIGTRVTGRKTERPSGWTSQAEEPFAMRAAFEQKLAPAIQQATNLAPDKSSTLLQEARKIFGTDPDGSKPRPTPQSPRVLLLEDEDLPLVAVALGLWHTAVELRGRESGVEMRALRQQLLAQPQSVTGGARRILRDLNWSWATHLSLRVNPEREPTDAEAGPYLRALHGLSVTVTRQPLERRRLVIPLGPRGNADPLGPMFERFGIDDPFTLELAARADAAKTGAEAVCRLFNPDVALWPLFEKLQSWRAIGWLEEATLTVLRTEALPNAARKLDDSVLCLDDFSDGEQEYIHRMGLFYILRDQPNTLLLLDEPETHFNDVWKREIVDVAETELLSAGTSQGGAARHGTACHVLITTHSSLALSDLFAEEITIFQKSEASPETGEEQVTAMRTTFPTFGSESGRILRQVFDAPDSIGIHARTSLDYWLAQDWGGRLGELEDLINHIGAGYHRAKLTEILEGLRAARNS